MALRPDEFYIRALTAADGEGRLPLACMTGWDIDLADLPDDLAAELGLLTTHVARHVQALPHISRAHVYRIGGGGAQPPA